ncbi:MAG: glycerophosphodiester phosphodiesterase, partial [Clostridiales Family XIII bacterium]|nr:glycerophosphodiester phosphodiesterase [Clostridiales Family XIII bacterium]
PTLGEALRLLAATGLTINIELKTGIVFYDGIEESVLRQVEGLDLLDRVVFSSFNHVSAARVKRLEPLARIAYLCGGGIITGAEQCERTGAYALHPDMRGARCPGLIADCRARGVRVHVWAVAGPDDLRFCEENGVDAVIVDDIRRFA